MAGLDGIEVFVKVAELASISAAARALGAAKSSVSRQIMQLEQRLGVALLQRNTRSLRLTEAGSAYYERCIAIVAQADAAARAIGSAGAGVPAEPGGRLRITATVGFGARYLAPVILEFMGAHPNVRMEVQLLDRRVNLVEEGFDLAIRMGVLPDSALIARRLGAVARVLCASPDYLARSAAPQAPEDLRRHQCLSVSVDQRRWALGGTSVIVPWRLACDNVEIVREAVLQGIGIALVPYFLVSDEIAAGRLVRVLPDAEPEPATFHALYAHARQLPLAARLFLDMLIRHFRAWPEREGAG